MAVIEIPDRVCPHCGTTRWITETLKTGTIRYRCPVLAQERRKRWKAKNPEIALKHEKKRAAKRVAEGYYKKRRQSIREQLNLNKMSKTDFFYTTNDIKELKELIRTGEPISRIAKRECTRFNTTPSALSIKMYKLAKNTTKIREWDGPKRSRTPKSERVVSEKEKGFTVPEGTTFEGTPKKVQIFKDHFRIYF